MPAFAKASRAWRRSASRSTPGCTTPRSTSWPASIRRLAERPNVSVKLGGMGMRINGFDFHTGARPPSSEALAAAWRPYVETCLEAFGPSRCMFESNFPVDKGSYGYAAYWNACKRLAAELNEEDKHELFSGTAARVYRLDLRAARGD